MNEQDAPDPLTWLQAWYATQCDGSWEHDYGVSIDTLDNPGWSLLLDLRGTSLEGHDFPKYEVRRGEHDWLVARVVEGRFEAACGPLNLGEAIHEFRSWAAGRAGTGRRPAG
ncbi:immunity 53 family protein [Actinoplanes siamensis]|uniref:Immunity protein 53 of polymorphic toxin system n=1 Tax=Actinoplanes siamensis TaxID=1223317 RepID=A0A919TKT8_9ACTN|nr:immunity 53 family protein [Actinoplanes siamensis]GIF05500.1 hypothetical protein Asi03nite_30380 [Actinoplanes siamensis]